MQNDLAIAWQHLAACRGEDSTYFFAPSYFERRAENDTIDPRTLPAVRMPNRDGFVPFSGRK